MPVTTSTHTGPFAQGFRAWVHVNCDYLLAPTGYEVLLLWDPAEVDFLAPSTTGPRPSWANSAQGFAVWVDVDLSAASCDFEVLLRCREESSGPTRIDGCAMKVESLDGARSSAIRDCSS